jgi:hypothetical protein
MRPIRKLSDGNIIYNKCIFCEHRKSAVVNVYKEIYHCYWCNKEGETSGKEFKQIYEGKEGLSPFFFDIPKSNE